MSTKRIVALDISDYDRNPDIFLKRPYCPGFGPRSTTWVIFYFFYQTVRGKIRVYESYGRSKEEAQLGLVNAKVKKADQFTNITEQQFKDYKKNKKTKKR